MTQSRFRSPIAWASIVALVVVVFNAYSLWGVIGIDADQFKEITNTLMAALIAFGIFNNPSDAEKF